MSTDDFFIEDYKLKVDYLTSQFGRMWIRFSFFLSVQTGIGGFFSYLLFDSKGRNAEATIIPILLGMFVSLLWYVVGAQDRALVEGYRDDMKDSATRIADKWAELSWIKDGYVGSRYVESRCKIVIHGPFSWYCSYTSITTLAAIIPVVVLLTWVFISAFYYKWMPLFGCVN